MQTKLNCFVFVPGLTQFHDEASSGNVSIFPYFDYNVPRNVTTATGQTAFLHCRVEQLGDKAVSFVTYRSRRNVTLYNSRLLLIRHRNCVRIEKYVG